MAGLEQKQCREGPALSYENPSLKEECLFSLALSPQMRKGAFGLFVVERGQGERERK